MGRMFANGPGDRGSLPSQVIPKIQKMVLDTYKLNTLHYMVSGWWYTKGNAEVKRYHKFSPNPPPKCRGEIFFGVLARRMTTFFDEQSLYIYICPEGWDTWLPLMSGTFTNNMELNTLSQRGQNRTTCNLAWSCQCIRFNSASLNPKSPRLFQLL